MGVRRIQGMKVTATIRGESGEVRELVTDAATYDAGYADLVGLTPDGWRMIAVGVER